MIKSVKEYENDMAQIILCLRDGNDLDELSVAIGPENYGDAMEECVRQGFLKGCSTATMANGKIIVRTTNPRPSYFGLKFLESA